VARHRRWTYAPWATTGSAESAYGAPYPGPMDGLLLALIGEMLPLRDSDEFRMALLEAIRAAVPTDWISINEMGPDPRDIKAVAVPSLGDEWLAIYARTVDTNPLVARFRDTQDGRPYRFSDVVTPAELHELSIWREFYSPLGIEHQIAFVLSAQEQRFMAIALSRRTTSPDFSDGERDLLTRARPYLIQAYRNALDHDALLGQLRERPAAPLRDLALFGLTPRERQVLLLVASGRTNADVAHELGVRPPTIKTHLERAYRKLGVAGRSEAARVVWGSLPHTHEASAAGSPQPPA
jgi:DNA-binding CsgD family transcriptional regulator